ncbi:MAG: hypothetical protein HC925_05105 [Coleofasciculaceae cyanobacterium SM2_3_26]|nr:hypothetical protein [Coleofasciculaceae cyanobacterium SM2_3_26]
MKYSPTLYYIVTFWFSLSSFILFSAFHKTWDFAIARGGSAVSGTVGDRLWGYNRGVEAFTLLGKGIYPAIFALCKGVF